MGWTGCAAPRLVTGRLGRRRRPKIKQKLPAGSFCFIFYAQSASAVSAQTALPAGMAKNAHIPDSGAGRAHNPKKLLFRQFLRPVNAGVNRPNYDILQPAFLKHLYRLDGGAAGGADFDFKLFGRILTFHCQLCRA